MDMDVDEPTNPKPAPPTLLQPGESVMVAHPQWPAQGRDHFQAQREEANWEPPPEQCQRLHSPVGLGATMSMAPADVAQVWKSQQKEYSRLQQEQAMFASALAAQATPQGRHGAEVGAMDQMSHMSQMSQMNHMSQMSQMGQRVLMEAQLSRQVRH